jgi:hypothetical protein
VVALIAEQAPLDESQWDGVSERLRAISEPFADDAFDARGIAATIPGELLAPVLDAAQWEMVKPIFGPRRDPQ